MMDSPALLSGFIRLALLISCASSLSVAAEIGSAPCGSSAPDFEDTRNLATLSTEVASCTPLSIDESSLIRTRDFSEDHPVPASYKLVRKSATEYEAVLNVDFVANRALAKALGKGGREAETQIRELAENCLLRISDHIRGPGGERLTIRLAQKGERLLPKRVRVELADNGERSNHLTWNPRFNACSAVVHEVFHLLGLVDEYREHERGYRRNADGGSAFVREDAEFAGFDCRHIGPEDSIMRDPANALRQAMPGLSWKLCSCPIPQPDAPPSKIEKYETCKQAVRALRQMPETCPANSSPIGDDYTFEEYFSRQDAIQKNCSRPASEGHSASFCQETSPARVSLLYPAQFRMITTGACQSVNRVYLNCARNAYRTSKLHLGEGCLAEPLACSSANHEWLK